MIDILYHKNCVDGFTSAWVASRFYRKEYLAGLLRFYPLSYGDLVPEDIKTSDRVFMLDFSFPREIIEKLARKCHLTILDHHQSAQKDLEGLPYAFFNMRKSGARMAWDYWFPDHPATPTPQMVLYAEDRDLGLYELPKSRGVAAAMAMVPFYLDAYNEFAHRLELSFSSVVYDGTILLQYQEKLIQGMIEHCLWADIDGHIIPVINTQVLTSDVANELLNVYKDCPFAAYFYISSSGKEYWGLRSRAGEKVDVSKIAGKYGGGGHKSAAGFRVEAGEIGIFQEPVV